MNPGFLPLLSWLCKLLWDFTYLCWNLTTVRLPACITVDHGTEFTSRALDCWAWENKVQLDFTRPGKPTDNGLCESFNGRLRDECLNTHEFESLEQARRIIEAWRRDYNDHRPHGSLGKLTPSEYVKSNQVRLLEVARFYESHQNWGDIMLHSPVESACLSNGEAYEWLERQAGRCARRASTNGGEACSVVRSQELV